jgi:two-component system sensor histidine kinase HydH
VRITLLKPLSLLWGTVTLVLPGLLIYSAIQTYRALENQKVVYLRSRMAAVASQLETLPAGIPAAGVLNSLEEEPGLLDVTILEPPQDAARDPLASLWLGRELFRTESVQAHGQAVFRAFVPFHGPHGLRLARIDLAASAADFLVEHARHHLWIVVAGCAVFLALSLLTAWSLRRLVQAERRQLELEHLAHIGEMSAVLAHEIRNPLGTIKGFAQLLEEKLPRQYDNLLNPILSQTVRLEGLVNDLLLYGRPAQPSPGVAGSREVAEKLHAHIEQIHGPLRYESRIADVTFETDVNLLEQALLNLLKNAVEALHGRAEGVVRLEVDQSRDEVIWRVLDDGPGMSPEARRRLFEPFYTSKAYGTGLGLSITRKLVDALGGKFSIGDRTNGGTVTEIRLPLRVPRSAA